MFPQELEQVLLFKLIRFRCSSVLWCYNSWFTSFTSPILPVILISLIEVFFWPYLPNFINSSVYDVGPVVALVPVARCDVVPSVSDALISDALIFFIPCSTDSNVTSWLSKYLIVIISPLKGMRLGLSPINHLRVSRLLIVSVKSEERWSICSWSISQVACCENRVVIHIWH